MARNGSGTFVIPHTFVADTPIIAADHNDNMSDVAAEITNSLALDGQSEMSAPLKVDVGSVTDPGIVHGSDSNSGYYHIADDNLGIAVGGTKIVDIAATGVTITGDVNSTDVNADTVNADNLLQNSLGVVALLDANTFSGSSFDIVLTTFTAKNYSAYRIVMLDVKTTADINILLRTSSNGGSSYDSGGADYVWEFVAQSSVPAASGDSDNSDASLAVCFSLNGADDVASFETTIWAPTSARHKLITTVGAFTDVNTVFSVRGSGMRNANDDVDAVQFFPESGTFTGSYRVYGIP